MGEVNSDYDGVLNGGGVVAEEEEQVHEWEAGLPNAADITPLDLGLIPPELLSAFNIKLEPFRTDDDVTRASKDIISTIRGQLPSQNLNPFAGAGEEDGDPEVEDDGDASDSKKLRRNESAEDADSAAAVKTLKRPRLVWTPQLHKRFVDVVAHLGIKNAVPKTIMQLMNVEGLTRENVASHLQKYRLYLKRTEGISFDGGPSNSLTASTEQVNSHDNGNMNRNGHVSIMGMGMGNCNGFGSSYHHHHNNQYNHNQHRQHYNGMMQTGNMYDSVVPYNHHLPPHVAPGDNQ